MNPLEHQTETQPANLNHSRNGHSRSLTLAVATSPAPGAQPALPPASPAVAPASPLPPSIVKGRPRTGAIAALPKDQRDMVCRMIARDVPYKRIAEALAELGFVVTERNISNWVTHGGYAEWCALFNEALQTTLRQDDLLQRHRNENSPELAEVGLQAAAVRLSELLLRQMAANQDLEGNVSKLEPVINLLCRINHQLFNAQKYRDDCQRQIFRTPARIKADERKKLRLTETAFSAQPKPQPRAASAPAAATVPPARAARPTPAVRHASAPIATERHTTRVPPAPAVRPTSAPTTSAPTTSAPTTAVLTAAVSADTARPVRSTSEVHPASVDKPVESSCTAESEPPFPIETQSIW